jgi:hypothetical protein
MKKYLMTGVAALTFAATFTSCSKAGDLYDEGKVEEQKIASVTEKYDDAFIKAFGQPAANQDWGFGSRQLPASFGSGTRTAQTNGNQWGTNEDNGKYKNYPAPAAITGTELEKVLAVFNQKGATSYEPLVHWENYFVQQVYTGPNGWKMNELASVTDMTVKQWWPLEYQHTGTYTDDIINNFNAGTCTAWDGCMLMWYSSTEDFSFKTSQSGGQRIYGHWRMEEIDGNYYVGFDHEAWRQAPANANEEDKRDYIYNDWIVKIVPGYGETIPDPDPDPKTYNVRIICEDLMASASSDFDFNDVVFDVNYIENVNKTFITIKAAGGTIPLYIEGREVHKLFQDAYPNAGIVLPADGVKGSMINTHASGGVEVDDVSLPLDGIIAPKDIKITINNGGTTIPLKAEVGQPAAKIAVDPSFQWLDERVDITKTCPDFPTFVKNGDINWY